MKKFLLLFLVLLIGCSENFITEPEPDDFQILSINKIINHNGTKNWVSFEFVLMNNFEKPVSELVIDVYAYRNKELVQHGRTTLFATIRFGDIVSIEVHLSDVPTHDDYDSWEYEIKHKE